MLALGSPDEIRYLNVYYRRTRRLDVPLITQLRTAPHPLPDTLKSDLDGWTMAEGDLRSGLWPSQDELRLYYKTRKQSGHLGPRQAVLGDDIITELDVVFGDDEPFYGFERVQGEKIVEAKEGKWESVALAYRRGNYGTSAWESPSLCWTSQEADHNSSTRSQRAQISQ